MSNAINKTQNSKKQKLIFGIVLALLVVAYNFIWLNRSFTMSEGWAFFYNGLLAEGKVPYRDFYYYLPPLNLLIDYIIWKISTGYFFIYRIIRLIERITIVEIMYSLISKRIDSFTSFVACFIGTMMASANVYDLVGDYNQTVQLLVALLLVFVTKYCDNLDNVKVKGFWMILTGICAGCMFLSKQTIALASAIVFVFFEFILLVTKKEKNIIQMIFAVGFGVCIPMGLAFVYLVYNRALTEFVYQVFMDTSSKGSIFDIIIGTQTNTVIKNMSGIIAVLAAFLIAVLARKNDSDSSKSNKIAKIALWTITCVAFTYSYYFIILDVFKLSVSTLYIIPFVIAIALLSIVDYKKMYGRITAVVMWVGIAALLFLNNKKFTADLYNETLAFSLIKNFATLIHFAIAIWFIYHILKYIFKKGDLDLYSLTLASGALASGWATGMTNGEAGVLTSTAFVSVPVFVYLIFKNVKDTKQVYIKLLTIISLFVLVICASQKIECNYSWWGDKEASFSEKTETSDIRALKGFKFSPEEKEKYDGLTKLIEENTTEDSVIFGFPYVKTYNVFLENYNMDNFVPVLFYDVCADDFAVKDAKKLKKNNPDIVVWLDISNCAETHEKIFRNGYPLGQRKIQSWFASVYETDYELIGQVDNVFVYKLKDGTKVDKKFIQRKSREASTLKSSALRKYFDSELELKGKGTKTDPYLISSPDDYELFRNIVNGGDDMEDKYVLQTADIDMSEVENAKPIGIFGTEKIFKGTYDGNGYAVKNLKISEGKKYNAMFGNLDGTVVNVSLIDCDIEGTYIAGIASFGDKNARIINCYASGKITAEHRASGIGDNINNGKIYNCVSTCKTKGENCAGIAGYYKSKIRNCYSSKGSDTSLEDGLMLDDTTCDKLNSQLSIIEKRENVKLNKWTVTSDGVKLTNEKN